MACDLLRLPPELLVDIFGRLPVLELVSLRTVCKFLDEAIASSARLQLVLDLHAFQVVVGPSVIPTSSDRLAALRQFCDGWIAMHPMRKQVIEHESMGCMLVNGYMIGITAVPGDPTQFWELPSDVLGRHRMKIRTAIDTAHEIGVIGVGPFQDLQIRLVINLPNGSPGCHVFLETFSTGMPHPEAAKPHLVISNDTQLDAETWTEGDLCDDILLVLFRSPFDFARGTAIWNWRTGERLFHATVEIQSHKLLSPSLVLQLSAYQRLRIFDLHQRRIVARLGLPRTYPKLLWQRVSSLPRDTPATCSNAPHSYRRGWLSGPESDIFIFKSRGTTPTDLDYAEEQQDVHMIVSKSSLLRVLTLYTEVGDTTFIPWRQWNSSARLFFGIPYLRGVPSGSRWGLLVNNAAFRAIEEGSWSGTQAYVPEEAEPSDLPFPGNRRRHVAILDFNPRVIRRAGNSASIDSDTSIVRTIQHTTTVFAPEIFMTPVESSLPFRISCAKEPVDYEDVQLDFENLVGFTTTSEGRTRIEIWSF